MLVRVREGAAGGVGGLAMTGGSGRNGAIPFARSWVNREAEIRALERALGEASDGRSRFVMLTGEAGIGKTRLADEMSRRARDRGVLSLWGRCWEGAGAPAYWPWVQIFRAYARDGPPGRPPGRSGADEAPLGALVNELCERLPGSFGPPSPGESGPAHPSVFAAAGELLAAAAAREPLMLTLDDLQGADPASLRLLQFLVHPPREARMLVVATCRVPVLDGTGTAALLEELRRDCLEIRLGGLGVGEVAALLAAGMSSPPPLSLVRRVHEVTEGNPFFVDEIARGFATGGATHAGATVDAFRIPEGIRQAIRWRLAVLASDSLGLLSLAAVIGRSFDLRVLRELAGVANAELLQRLGDASRLDVIRPSPEPEGTYTFLHGLVRETLYEDVPAARRAEAHRRIGEILEARPGGASLGALASHFSQAAGIGCAEKAARYSFRAGQAAEGQRAWEEAATRFTATLRALEHVATPMPAVRAEAWIHLGENQGRLGDRTGAATSFRSAIDLARSTGDAERQARAALALGALAESGRGAEPATGGAGSGLVRHLEDALERLPSEDSALRARLLGRLAAVRAGAPGSPARGLALAGQAVSMARRLGDGATLAAVLGSRREAPGGPDDLEDRHDAASEAVRLARDAGDRERELLARAWRLWDSLELGRLGEAWRDVEEYGRLARHLRQPFALANAAAFEGLRATIEGRYADARRIAAGVDGPGGERQAPAADRFGMQAFVLAWEEGRLADLEETMAGILSRRPGVAAVQALVPLVWCELGRFEAARAELERLASNDFLDLPRDLGWLFSIACLSIASVHLRDVGRSRRLYELLLPYRRRLIVAGPPPSAVLGPAEWALGRLAHVTGATGAAEEHLGHAIRIAEEIVAPGFRARALVALAAIHADAGDAISAARRLDEGQAVARSIGMATLDAEARALAARLGQLATPGSATEASLKHEGDFWLFAWRGRSVRLEDAKGIRYLARLLGRPGKEIHVADLMRGLAPAAIRAGLRPGHAGEDLDARAATEYRERLAELERELDAAERARDRESLEALRTEADFIRRELTAAHGLGGRRRRSVDDVERLRKTVSSRIRQSAERIARLHPALGEHLRESVRTGTFCAYEPKRRVEWAIEE